MAKTRVLLLGSEGIGTIAALNLECGGQAHVTAVRRSNFQTVTDRGFEILDHGRLRNWRPSEVINAVPEVAHSGVSPFDYIVCTTKNIPDIGPPICDIIAPAPFAKRFAQNILSRISRIDAHEIAPGVIEQIDHDNLQIGAFGGLSQTPNIDLPRETIATILAKNPPERMIYPSMQKDVTKGNFLEHEVIIGEVIREAQGRGIATPILSTLYHLWACLQWGTQQGKAGTRQN
ncbi:uncharacterized protein BP01DRAFT_384136 [Aspergillus saccharolyticus JOP 1030-1]|uniref:Uncharacterized protein n=1 Tax=Aspergillus saccharolyticus JOP 1030-1 TaxID=1450539 RepID=A0A318ZGP9_9EURO|nr:hypothetical protein BP01DRAFT_384136 [Aspergillus saccharolyticus JOP 1030-1]PYH43753.1 hypothetical protein BP01DRAFT_384136 [Aspergillus saccharolyticus JOP 1030-1]